EGAQHTVAGEADTRRAGRVGGGAGEGERHLRGFGDAVDALVVERTGPDQQPARARAAGLADRRAGDQIGRAAQELDQGEAAAAGEYTLRERRLQPVAVLLAGAAGFAGAVGGGDVTQRQPAVGDQGAVEVEVAEGAGAEVLVE